MLQVELSITHLGAFLEFSAHLYQKKQHSNHTIYTDKNVNLKLKNFLISKTLSTYSDNFGLGIFQVKNISILFFKETDFVI